MRDSNKIGAHLALLGTQLFFAINYTSIKYLINHQLFKPFGLNLVRVIVAATLFSVIRFWRRKVTTKIEQEDLWRFFLCALTGIAINQLLFVKGLSLTYSMHASFLMLTTPIMITLIAAWWLKERLGIGRLIGLSLGIIGSVLLINSGKQQAEVSDPFWGDILVAINAVSYSLYFVLVKPLMKKYDALSVLQIIFTLGFFLMLPFCWSEFSVIAWEKMEVFGWLNLSLVTIGGTFFAYLLNIYGLKHLGASAAGGYIYIQPVMTVILAAIFLHEHLDKERIMAAFLIFLGVYLTIKQNKQKSIK